jgi:hypothetical protein
MSAITQMLYKQAVNTEQSYGTNLFQLSSRMLHVKFSPTFNPKNYAELRDLDFEDQTRKGFFVFSRDNEIVSLYDIMNSSIRSFEKDAL